jgi:tRNA modification GTPase
LVGSTLFRTTIYALSSGGLPSGVAVVRLSGPDVKNALTMMVGAVPEPRQSVLRAIRDAEGNVLDRGLAIFFDGPRSFTGEDCAELQLHGGKAVVAAVLGTLSTIPGFHHAEAGEFTRRAFLHGKLDLTEAEGLSDLIAAETEVQRRFALQNSSGGQKQLYAAWARTLLQGRALIEAELDFADEADVPGSVSDQVWEQMTALHREIRGHIAGFRASEIIRDGYRVVLVGEPNAGKSSLLNALAKRDVAIVTEVPGTTRDLVEVALDIDGQKVILTDTAGLRETSDVVERIGVARALSAVETGDLVINLVAPTGNALQLVTDAKVLLVQSKADIAALSTIPLKVSSLTGEGLDQLLRLIGEHSSQATAATGQILPSRIRHIDLLNQTCDHIFHAIEAVDEGLELRAERLRLAGTALGRITGMTDVEDLLDVIFSEFCIGK